MRALIYRRLSVSPIPSLFFIYSSSLSNSSSLLLSLSRCPSRSQNGPEPAYNWLVHAVPHSQDHLRAGTEDLRVTQDHLCGLHGRVTPKRICAEDVAVRRSTPPGDVRSKQNYFRGSNYLSICSQSVRDNEINY